MSGSGATVLAQKIGPRRPSGWPFAVGMLAGLAADAVIGDPRYGHPVAFFGRCATAIERRVYADSHMRGAAFTASCLALAAAPALAASRLSRHRPAAQLSLLATCTWAVTAARSLTGEAELIRRALLAGDVDSARRRLPSLCGRDPDDLDTAEIARAVVESVAENTCDAIVAPLVWGALGGMAGLTGYRGVNTLDAMVGHRSPRYEQFGWTSARLDDVANYAPARLTAALAAALAPVVAGRRVSAWRLARRYGPRHPSPNAGWCEAAFAGALGIRLGGALSYAGRAERRPELGSGRAAGAQDIARAIRLCRAVTAVAGCLAAGLAATTPAG